MKTQLLITLISILISASSALASNPRGLNSNGRRLIQTGPQTKTWMTEEETAKISKSSHAAGHCGGYIDITNHQNRIQKNHSRSDVLFERSPKMQRTVNYLMQNISLERVLSTVEELSSFKNRYYKSSYGEDAAVWIQNQFLSIAANRNDVSVQLFKHEFRQPSVIARIQGQGPHANEIVVIGAHEDSIDWSSGFPGNQNTAPGADDDASGVASVLEIFKTLIDSGFQPDRTIDFMTYAGEEKGLLGSMDIAQAYEKSNANVIGVMQFDMTLYPGTARKLTFITDHVDTSLTKFTETLMDTYVQTPWQESKCGYACSDHASWTEAGYASVFPFETAMHSYNPHIHSPNDIMDYLDASYGLSYIKLGVAFLTELSSEQ